MKNSTKCFLSRYSVGMLCSLASVITRCVSGCLQRQSTRFATSPFGCAGSAIATLSPFSSFKFTRNCQKRQCEIIFSFLHVAALAWRCTPCSSVHTALFHATSLWSRQLSAALVASYRHTAAFKLPLFFNFIFPIINDIFPSIHSFIRWRYLHWLPLVLPPSPPTVKRVRLLWLFTASLPFPFQATQQRIPKD